MQQTLEKIIKNDMGGLKKNGSKQTISHKLYIKISFDLSLFPVEVFQLVKYTHKISSRSADLYGRY